jgi:hypothetical protein
VDTLFFTSGEERAAQKGLFFDTARKLYVAVGPRNEKQRVRLEKIVTEIAEVPEKEKDLNADALVDVALRLVEKDPAKALELGTAALAAGNPRSIYRLVWSLNKYRPPLAVRLFSELVRRATGQPTYNRLQQVQLAAFPEMILSNAPPEFTLARSERIAALRMLAQFIVQARAQFAGDPSAKCSGEARLLGALASQYAVLLPSEAGVVQQGVAACLGVEAAEAGPRIDPFRGKTVDELLKLADEAGSNMPMRVAYLTRAALLSLEKKNYEPVIKILDGMTDKERAVDEEVWDDLRAQAAAKLAIERFAGGDYQAGQKILEQVPASIRGFAGLGVLLEPSGVTAEIVDEILSDSRKSLARSEKAFRRKSPYWFAVAAWASRSGRTGDAVDILQELISAYNDAASEKANAGLELVDGSTATGLSAELLVEQESRLFQLIGRVSSPKSRLRLYFGLLDGTIQRYDSVRKDAAKDVRQSAGKQMF